MKLRILLPLSVCLLAGAACADHSASPAPADHSASPAPARSKTDFVYAAQSKYAAGISWDEAKSVVEQENIKVKAMTIFEPRPNADYYVALVITETGTRQAYELRPYSSDGKEFFWKAASLPPKLFEQSLFPNAPSQPASGKE